MRRREPAAPIASPLENAEAARDELGDLILNVLFQARIAEEKELKAKFSSLDEAVSSVGAELSVDDLEKEISEIQ